MANEPRVKVASSSSKQAFIAFCPGDCRNLYQDARYGKGNRAFNPVKNGKGRCSVCEKILN